MMLPTHSLDAPKSIKGQAHATEVTPETFCPGAWATMVQARSAHKLLFPSTAPSQGYEKCQPRAGCDDP